MRGNTNYLLSSVVHTSSTFGIFTKEQPTITRGTHGWLFYCQVDNILVSKGFQYKGHSYRDEPKTWVQTDIPEQISSTFFFYLHYCSSTKINSIFTVFDGFSTFSSDSFSYIRLARNLSPYVDSSVANSMTLPEHARSPGFPWLLAITGAASSTYAAHLMVSISMLSAISVFGWMAFRQLGSILGGLLTISVTLLPGVVISSMTILTENPYICASLAVLLLYSYIRKNISCGRGWYAALLLVLTLAILIRTIGVSLAIALMIVATFDRKLGKQSRINFLLFAGISLVIWQ